MHLFQTLFSECELWCLTISRLVEIGKSYVPQKRWPPPGWCHDQFLSLFLRPFIRHFKWGIIHQCELNINENMCENRKLWVQKIFTHPLTLQDHFLYFCQVFPLLFLGPHPYRLLWPSFLIFLWHTDLIMLCSCIRRYSKTTYYISLSIRRGCFD